MNVRRDNKKQMKKKETPQERYHKAHTIAVNIRLMKNTEQDIIQKLNSVPNKAGYIKALIRADIKKQEETKMKKIATITPINCITVEQDGEEFEILWNQKTKKLIAKFESGTKETLEYKAKTLTEAIDTVHALYAQSIGYIYEQSEEL